MSAITDRTIVRFVLVILNALVAFLLVRPNESDKASSWSPPSFSRRYQILLVAMRSVPSGSTFFGIGQLEKYLERGRCPYRSRRMEKAAMDCE